MSTEVMQFIGQALLTAAVIGVPLLIKTGRLQQQVANLEASMARVERAQEELLRREVFTSEIRGLEARLVRIEERIQNLETAVFLRGPKSET